MSNISSLVNIILSSILASSLITGAVPGVNNINLLSDSITISSKDLMSLPDVIKTEKKAIVNCAILNVRLGTGTKYRVAYKLKRNTVVTVLSEKSGWTKIKMSNNKTGWVSSKYLKVKSIMTTTTPSTNKTSSSASNTTTSNKVTITFKPTISASNTNTGNLVTNSSSASNTNMNTPATNLNIDNKIKDSIINEILLTEGNVNSIQISTLKENLYKIPTALLKGVKDRDLKVLLTTKDVKDYYKSNANFSGTMTGLFDPMAYRIYISSNVSHINKSTIHEFGHALDLLIGKKNYVSLSNKWKEIFLSEKHTASGSYYMSNPQEYFADSFNTYILNPSKLQKTAPRTYAYIHSAIKEL